MGHRTGDGRVVLMAAWSLARLIEPLDLSLFMSDIFGQRPLCLPLPDGGDRDRFASLLDWQVLNRLLSMQGCWHSDNLKLVSESRSLPPERYCQQLGPRQWRPVAKEVMAAIDRGATLVLNGLDGLHPPIAALIDEVEQTTASRGQANIYLSTAGRRGFGLHYDRHDVIILQISGSKRWRIYRDAVAQPDLPQPPEPQLRRLVGPCSHEWILRPGDLLYLPAGVAHDPFPLSGSSLHLTLALKVMNRYDILQQALQGLDHDMQRHRHDLYQGEGAIQRHLQAVVDQLQQMIDTPTAIAEMRRQLNAMRRDRSHYHLAAQADGEVRE
jgi:hypothetical protein